MSQLLKYDVIYILNPNSTTEEAAAVSAKVEQIVTEAKGTVLKKDDWGKRRLAYLVDKHREGIYVFYHLSIPATAVAEVTRNLRLLEKVIKFSVVKDTISHLKPKPRPVRTSVPRPEGSSSRPSYNRSGSSSSSHSSSSAPVNPSTTSAAPVAAPAAPVTPAPQA
jgi:small subunit ribosomal protein S6